LGDALEGVTDPVDDPRGGAGHEVPRRGVGRPGVRVGGRHLPGGGDGIPEVAEGGAAQLVPHHREVLLFLFLHVMADVLHEHLHLGLEALVLGVHAVELGEHPLHDVVLLEALERDVLGLGHRRSRHRVEQLLLDGSVDGELLDDLVDDRALLGHRAVSRPLEPLEERLDGLVVVLEQRDRVHGSPPYPFGRRRTPVHRACCWDVDDLRDPPAPVRARRQR
jgi:hypothetical protein